MLALYAGAMAETLSRERLGRFAATVLAHNAVYGVLTADRPLLKQQSEATIASLGQDVVGVVIRDSKQEVLAQVWSTGESPPALPSATDALREQKVFGAGEGRVLFSAPVMVSSASTHQVGQVDLAMRTTQARRSSTGVVARMLVATAFLSVGTVLLGRVLAWREG